MKYYSRLKLYKASNVTFDPIQCRVYSYDWWRFVDRIRGKVIFNSYTYSNSTVKHQFKLRRLLESLNINVDIMLKAPRGLQDLDSAVRYYESEIEALESAINAPGSRSKTNVKRRDQIEFYKSQIMIIKDLIGSKECD